MPPDVLIFVACTTVVAFALCLAVIMPPVDEYRTWRYEHDVHAQYIGRLRELDQLFQAQRAARRPTGAHRQHQYRPQRMYPAHDPLPPIPPAPAAHIELTLTGGPTP